MKNTKKYNIYIFISTFTRNIVDIYSVIFLYQKGLSIKSIIAIYAITYFIGTFISSLSIRLGNKFGYKYILILSSIVTGLTFYIINKSSNIYLISLFLSLSMFTYHPIKHYYGLKVLKEQKEIGTVLIYTYLASLLSTYLAIKKTSLILLLLISIIGIIPALFIKKEPSVKIKKPQNIPKEKISFFIFDQFKIIFILLEPLYLYLISNNLTYVGIFNIILTISSIFCVYLFTSKININKQYKYLNIIFTIILLLKINTPNKTLLLITAFFEGLGIRLNELISNTNLYSYSNLSEGYIISSEKIFCITRSIILTIIYLFNLNLKTSLYLLIIGTFILSFKYHPSSKKKNTI